MPIEQTIARSLRYKQYASSVITPGTIPAQATDPSATGGQILRHRAGGNFNLQKSNFRGREKRTSRQVFDMRHGAHNVPVEISGDMSCKTYQDIIAAILGASWSAAVAKSNVEFGAVTITSGVATVSTSTWAAQNYRVGDIVRFTNLSVAANNSKNVQISALSGVAATFLPALADNTSDAAWNVTTVGRKAFAPLSSIPIPTLFLLETYGEVTDISYLAKQVAFGGMRFVVPPEGIVDFSATGMGRTVERLATGSSPFFAAPTAETSTNLLTSNNGQLLIGGVSQGVITGIDINVQSPIKPGTVAFSNYFAGISKGTLGVTGTVRGMLQDNVIPGYFDAETEFEIALMLTDSVADAAAFFGAFMPRVKLGAFEVAEEEDGPLTFTANFEALERAATTGYDSSAISFVDALSA